MDGMKIETVSPELAPLVNKTAQPAARAPAKKEAAPVAPPAPPAPKEDRVDVGSAKEAAKDVGNLSPQAGKTYDYTVNSMHEVVIKVIDEASGREIRQIPDKDYQTFKENYRKVIKRLFDKKV